MKGILRKCAAAAGVVLATMLFSSTAFASCGLTGTFKPSAYMGPALWSGQQALMRQISAYATNDPIVGMWHVKFIAEGNEGGPPDDTVIDNAIIQWHNDGLETQNSSRPPQDGQICQGVWEKVGKSQYVVNHIAWSGNDDANGPAGIGNPTGPVRSYQNVTLSADGNHYSGTFTLSAYDVDGNLVGQLTGVISGTRVTVDTTVPELLN